MRKQPKKATMKGGLVTCEAPASKTVVKAAKARRQLVKDRKRGRPLAEHVISDGKVAAGDMDFHWRPRVVPFGVYVRVARTDIDGRPAAVVVQRWNRETDQPVRGSTAYRLPLVAYETAKRLASVSLVLTYTRADTSDVFWLSPTAWSRLQVRLRRPVTVTTRDDAAVIRRRQQPVAAPTAARESVATRAVVTRSPLDTVRGQRFGSFAALAAAVKEAR